MNVIGTSIVTADGIKALATASANGKSIKPRYFKFSKQDLEVDAKLTANDIVGWVQKDISLYQILDNETIEFVCDVEPTSATDYAKFAALYLEDGTLFMVARPPYPFPPALRQTFKIQMTYQNATGLVDFKYIPFSQTEQDLSLLNNIVVGGNQILKNCLKIEKIKIRGVN